MPYPFPDPAVTPEFEAENGITYIWGGDKWVVKTFTSPTNYITPAVADTEYVRIDGTSTMTGNLTTTAGVYGMNLFSNNKVVATQEYVGTYAVPAAGTQSTTSPFEVSTAIKHTGYNYFQKSGNSFYISCESGPTIFGVSTGSSAAESAANYYGKCTADNHIVNKAYLEGNTLPKTGNLTISGTAKFTNQTALNFEYAGDQSVLTKDDLLFFGLKADNSKPSWEACKIGIDPNNENFSAFHAGKRFYWENTYTYLNGSLRNYLNGWSYDFRNNDTSSSVVVLSISGSAVTYNGSTTGSTSIQTKESVDAAISSNLSTYVQETDTLGGSYLFQNHANNVGSTLDGFFLFEYSKSSSGMVNIIVNAVKNTSILNGDVVGTLPEGYRPTAGRWPVFTLINQNKDTTAQCVVTDDGKVTFIQVSGASTKFTGQLTFSTHSG